MQKQDLQKKTEAKQQHSYAEIEEAISLLEEENRLQKENALLHRQMEDYVETVHRMLDDISSQEERQK